MEFTQWKKESLKDVFSLINSLTIEKQFEENRNFGSSQKRFVLSRNIRTLLKELNYDYLENREDREFFRKFSVFPNYIKNNISIKGLFHEMSAPFSPWLFVEVPKLYERNITDLSILIVSSDELEEKFKKDEERFNNRPFYESVLNDVLEQYLPLNHEAPFLIFIISEEKCEDYIVEELLSNNDSYIIEKSIEFSPEHFQAGMGILAYFGEVLKRKEINNASVRIIQDNNTVKLQIQSDNGDIEVIEKTLEEYSLVISNQASADILYNKPSDILALQQKLEIAKLEVKQTRDILQLTTNLYSERICSLEDEIKFMRNQFNNQSVHIQKNQDLISQVSASNEKIILAQINQNTVFLEEILEYMNVSEEVEKLIYLLKEKLNNNINEENDKEEIRQILLEIKETDESVFNEIKNALRNTAYGVSGNFVFQWLQTLI